MRDFGNDRRLRRQQTGDGFDSAALTTEPDQSESRARVDSGEALPSYAEAVRALRVEELDPTRLYLNEIGFSPLLTAEEEVRFSRRAKQGDEQARKRMIESNLRLVVKIARRYLNRGLPLLDLVEEGNLGLMHAVEKFDPELGYRFSTYATWWIRQTIERGIMNQTRTVRLPIHVVKTMNSYLRTGRELEQQLDRPARCEEIAEVLNKPVGDVRQSLALRDRTTSVDEPLGVDGDMVMLDSIADEQQASPEDVLQQSSIHASLNGWLSQLSDKQRDVIERRFGLAGHERATLEAVGAAIGLTRERVRQIQIEGLAKLRGIIGRAGLSPETLFH